VAVVDVGHAARHAGAEVAPGAPEHDYDASRHVLAGMIADALHDRGDSGVAHAEALAGHAADVSLAGGGSVESHVADDDVLVGLERRRGRRIDDDLPARQALAYVVVRVPFDRQGHAAREEGAEALPRGAYEFEVDRVLRQALGAEALGDLGA